MNQDWEDLRNDRVETLVADWILKLYKGENPRHHLSKCPGASVSTSSIEGDSSTTMISDVTAAEVVSLGAIISCPCGERAWYSYGDYGQLDTLIEDIEAGDI